MKTYAEILTLTACITVMAYAIAWWHDLCQRPDPVVCGHFDWMTLDDYAEAIRCREIAEAMCRGGTNQ